ncbi:MAG: SMP-30/gluconolactonase/LRE family protein [Hyphomicrobiaceae bacterium]|nr:SMP-30/gluconolactonase/LRE family protein [Hyphomicrobiaceae bacterium]
MVPAPKVIETTIYATMPKELLLDDRDSPFTRDMFHGQRIGAFLEGPSFDRQGNLLMVDIAHGRILKLSTAKDWSVVAQYDGLPNGLKLHKDGRIFVTDRMNGIMVVDPVSGRVEPFIGRDRLPGFKGPNDLFFSSKGDLYFTDQGETGFHDPTGRVFRYSASGKLDCLIDNVPSPNGLVMDPAETTLYFAVTRANAVWRMPIRADGSIHRVGLYCQLVGGWGPDGMAVDTEGNVSMAHAGGAAVWVWSPMGLPLYKVAACDGGTLTTNMAYGGAGNRTMFITNSLKNNVLAAELPVPGLQMYGQM